MKLYNSYIEIKNNIPKDIILVVVSKKQSICKIKEIYNLGQKHFAENQVQELLYKINYVSSDIFWHFIGHLQSNKVKYIVPFIGLIHSIDRLSIMYKVQLEAKKINRKICVLLQLKISEDKFKYGLSELEFYHIISLYKKRLFPNIVIQGVMGIASLTEDQTKIKYEFLQLKNYFDFLKLEIGSVDYLSMGMSKDYKLAIFCGSTMIRIGSNIFL